MKKYIFGVIWWGDLPKCKTNVAKMLKVETKYLQIGVNLSKGWVKKNETQANTVL